MASARRWSTIPGMDLKRVPPTEARRLAEDEGYLILDVRSVQEFESEHIPGAYNVPFLHKTEDGMVPNPDFASVLERLAPDKDRKIVTHCAMGGRSQRAARQMTEMGYSEVVDMLGGFASQKDDDGKVVETGWKDSGLPTEEGPGRPKSYADLGGTAPGVEAPREGMNRFASEHRTVQCKKLGRELPGLKRRPYPGALGERLFAEISALAWDEWVEHSKILINEYRIVTTDPKAMEMLYEQCEAFFFGDGIERPAEYVPVS